MRTINLLRYFLIAGLLLNCINPAFSQLIIKGILKDIESNQPIPFAFIQTTESNTTSDKNGKFQISFSNKHIIDTIVVSQINYQTFKLTIQSIQKDSVIFLKRKEISMSPVLINRNRNGKIKIVGNKSKREKYWGYIVQANETLFNTIILKDTLFKIEKIKIFCRSFLSPIDYYPIRIHFYKKVDWYINPDTLNFVPKHGSEITSGLKLDFAINSSQTWTTIDLSAFNIWSNSNEFVIGIESLLPVCEEFDSKDVYKKNYNIAIGFNKYLKRPTSVFMKGGTWQCLKDGKLLTYHTPFPYYYGFLNSNLKIQFEIYLPNKKKGSK